MSEEQAQPLYVDCACGWVSGLGILAVGEVVELVVGAIAGYVLFGCLGRYAESVGYGEVGLSVELGREGSEVRLSDDGRCVCGAALGGWQRAEDVGSVLEQHASHSECCVEIGIGGDNGRADVAIVDNTEGGEYHGNAECDKSQSAHRGNDVESEDVGVFGLYLFKETVELLLLLMR